MPCRKITLSQEGRNYAAGAEIAEFMARLASRHGTDPAVEDGVKKIIADVRSRGDEAVLEYSRRFDCQNQTLPLTVSQEDIRLAAASLPGRELEIITEAAAHIREFHEAQKEKSWFITRPDGSILGQKVDPVERVGLYVPGGKGGDTPLISSVLMGAVPAQVAGVPHIALASPPRPDGTLSPYILAAAYLLEIPQVYCMGGPWAIAALAWGTASVAPVDVIAGPGNIHVTTAKRLVQGQVGIDMLAGPSEILVLADDSARPDWLAADMLSQAEHDSLASAVCITTSAGLADRVLHELEQRVATLPRAELARKALADWSAVIVAPHLDAAVELANAIAPEHLEVVTRDPWRLLPSISNAGAVFLGAHAPEAVGDYYAGPNHVLPTMGTARFASALSVQTFCKKTSVVAPSPEFTRTHAASIATLARLEGLEAHARSVEIRQ